MIPPVEFILTKLLHGLSFFTMGIVTLLHTRKTSSFRLFREGFALALFGLIHGLYHWSTPFFCLIAQQLGPQLAILVQSIVVIMNSLAFLALLYFGVSIIVKTLRKWFWLRFLPLPLFCFWLIHFVGWHLTVQKDLAWWIIPNVEAHYWLLIPGAVAACYGLLLQRLEFSLFKPPRERDRHLTLAAVTFGAYAVIAVVFIFPVTFSPVFSLDRDCSPIITRLPKEMISFTVSFLMAYAIIRLFSIYSMEAYKRLELVEKQHAVLHERERIARDLHDGIIQMIYGVGLSLENCLYLLQENPQAAEKELETNMQKLNGIIHNIRSYIMDLRTRPTLKTSLIKQLNELITATRTASGLNIGLSVTGEEHYPISGMHLNHIYHIIQEALTNAIKHAEASKITVAVDFRPQHLDIRVTDNGKGFHPALVDSSSDRGQHHGLTNMAERAEIIDASLSVHSSPGKGTIVHLKLPYKE